MANHKIFWDSSQILFTLLKYQCFAFQIFFRNSDLEVGENIDLGDNVEFTIQTRNGKEVATNIIKLVAGTVVFEDVGTEYFRGQVLKVSSQKKILKI